jgi:hypothetical protein
MRGSKSAQRVDLRHRAPILEAADLSFGQARDVRLFQAVLLAESSDGLAVTRGVLTSLSFVLPAHARIGVLADSVEIEVDTGSGPSNAWEPTRVR